MCVCVCVCFGQHSNASNPFTINMGRMQGVIRRPLSGNTHLDRTDMFLERRATVYYSALVTINVCECVCVCVIVNKHFSSSVDGLWRAALISNIIYLLVPCMGHTHTHSHKHTWIDRNSAVYSITHQRSTSFPHPSLCTPSFNPFLLPSLKSMECFVTQCCVSCNIHLKGKKKLISHSMNFHKLCLAVICK